jgi:hypothetical protein
MVDVYLFQGKAYRLHDLHHTKESKDHPRSFHPLLHISDFSPPAEEHFIRKSVIEFIKEVHGT